MSKTDTGRGVYASEDIERFVADTRTPPTGILEPVYVIGVGDLLDVVFLVHSNLNTHDLQVRPDGRVSLPYVGDQMAAGLTPMTLDSLLTDHYSEILRDPNLSVIVKRPAPRKVYVLGEVERPGGYEYDDQISVVQSLALAGGMQSSAAKGNVVLIRRDGIDRVVGIEVDVGGILEGFQIKNDIRLRNYDVVYVPKRALNSAAEFTELVRGIVLMPLDIVWRSQTIWYANANYEFFQRQ